MSETNDEYRDRIKKLERSRSLNRCSKTPSSFNVDFLGNSNKDKKGKKKNY
jgi:hypothetical protein